MQRAILTAAVIGLSFATCATEANAQFSFGYGNSNFGISVGPSMGYGRYPYGAYGFGNGNAYGYDNYGRPRYNVYVPTPSYRTRSGGSYSRRGVAPAQIAQPVGDGLPIKIVSPDDAGTSLKYSLNE